MFAAVSSVKASCSAATVSLLMKRACSQSNGRLRDVGLVVDLSGARHYAFVISSEKLAAFALMSAATSLVPGPSMLFILGEAAWRGGRRGAWALAGVQFGYIWWWFLAALGLGALALAFPMAFRVLALAGVLYLAWLGLQ